MHLLQKHKAILKGTAVGTLLVLANIFLFGAAASAATTCTPDVNSPQAYQQCVTTATPGTIIVCQNGSSVTAPAKCSAASSTGVTPTCSDGSNAPGGDVSQCFSGTPHCGGGENAVKMSFSIDCQGRGNPIMDAVFAIIRFLSAGVGLVIVGSMVFAGIQYSSSRGDPNASALAIKRIQSNVIALLIFIFASAILDFVIPGVFLK